LIVEVAMSKITLSTPLENGWSVSEAFFYGISPIVMVVLVRAAKEIQVRLDLGKRMFLDPTPEEIDRTSAAESISKSIISAQAEPAGLESLP
jgi:hypothetical protein